MRVLIIGGSGFLGSHVVDKFIAEGAQITVFDRAPEKFRATPSKVKFVHGDIGNSGAVEETVSAGFDAVLHFVSTTTPKTSNESPEFDIQSNVIGTVNLLDVCVKHRVGKFLFLSSGGTVYGDIGEVASVNEMHPVGPLCSYGISKLSIEHYLHMYERLYGLNYVVLRISNPYGERQDPRHGLGALTIFLQRVLKSQTIEVWGDGSITRDFIYAGDVANAIYQATINPINGIFNIGSGVGVTIRELLRTLHDVTQIEPRVVWLSARSFDVPKIVLDCAKIRTAIGWSCNMPLRDGIARTATWLKSISA